MKRGVSTLCMLNWAVLVKFMHANLCICGITGQQGSCKLVMQAWLGAGVSSVCKHEQAIPSQMHAGPHQKQLMNQQE